MSYIELHASSAFSFLRGGSFPEQLAKVAAELEMPALALLDRDGVYGAQRFSVAAREQNVRPIIGCELSMEDGRILPVLVENRTGYKNVCELLTQAHLRSEKGSCAVKWNELPEFADGLIALLGSACVSHAGFGVAPKRTFRVMANTMKFHDDEGAITRDTRATHSGSCRPLQRFNFSMFQRCVRFAKCPAQKLIRRCTRRTSRLGSRCVCPRIRCSFLPRRSFPISACIPFAKARNARTVGNAGARARRR